jgi:hypothetical protein
MDIKKTPKNAKIFNCEKCNFKCFKNSEWVRHTMTRKHKMDNKWIITDSEKNAIFDNISTHICVCGKEYKYNTGLFKHQKKCPNYLTIINDQNSKNEISPELILELIKENKELKELLVGQNKTFQEQTNTIIELTTKINNNIVNSTVNSNNKVFNLHLFLNDTCKDAMNIKDFVESIKLQLSDLENVGQVGFVNGISKIFVKNLKSLKQENRPVHCTDEKRKVIYVKDENQWKKDDNDHNNVRRAIKHVAKHNFMMMKEFKQKYPCCMNPDSKYNSIYHKLLLEALGGSGNENTTNENKIISNISREVTIKK